MVLASHLNATIFYGKKKYLCIKKRAVFCLSVFIKPIFLKQTNTQNLSDFFKRISG